MSHLRMRHVTHTNESCHTYERVMSHNTYHFWYVTRISKSCHAYKRVSSHTWMSHVTRMNAACHAYKWVTSHIWTKKNHITQHIPFLDHNPPSLRQMKLFCHSGMQCVATCCSMLQCTAACCSVLQCVATDEALLSLRYVVRCSVLQYVAVYYGVLQGVTVCCDRWSSFVAQVCSALQCVAVCSALQRVAVYIHHHTCELVMPYPESTRSSVPITLTGTIGSLILDLLHYWCVMAASLVMCSRVAVCCNILQCVVVCFSVLQYVAVCCSVL